MALNAAEIQRKVLHGFSGLLVPAIILYSPVWVHEWFGLGPYRQPWLVPFVLLSFSLAIFVVVEYVRLRGGPISEWFNRMFGSMLREEESRKVTGATYINASAVICTFVFQDVPEIAAISLSLFIWGDAVAALVGLSIGRIRIGKKSLEGSIGCFLICFAMFYLLFPPAPGLLDPWGGFVPLWMAALVSLCITLFELFPIKLGGRLELNDNLTVPVITGLLMWWIS